MTFSAQFIFRVRRCVYGALAGFDRLFHRPNPMVVVFAYHSIASDDWRFSIDREMFEKQMECLLSVRTPVTLADVQRHISGERPIALPSFALCFDDGYRDILSVREFLKQKGIRPALFVLADSERADTKELGTNREFLTAEDIQSLYGAGWEVGCHSATHGDFWAMSPSQVRKETAGAKEKLEHDLGIPIRYFAYPRGRYTDGAQKSLRDAGYEMALSMDDGVLSAETDPFAVPRIGVDRTHSTEEFRAIHTNAAILFRKVAKKFIGTFL